LIKLGRFKNWTKKTYSLVELGAGFLAIFLELLLGIGGVTGELALDLCGYSVGVA
jgi:hypothetical protein